MCIDKPDSNKEDLVMSIIKRMRQINQITDHGELQGDLFRLIQLWFPTFCNKNKKFILNIILSLKNQGKLMPDDREGKILSILLMDVLLIYFCRHFPLII